MNNGTKVRMLVSLLLLVATTVCGMSRAIPAKESIGCSRADDAHGTAGPFGCDAGGDGCYTCVHTTGGADGGSYTCYENADGTIGGCTPGDGSGGPYTY